jgi:glycosyltransferase involved in cell wall biosynthesis
VSTLPVDVPRFEALAVGMSASLIRHFTYEDIQAFARLAPDAAPVHVDAGFARKMGYADVLVHHCDCSVEQLEARYPLARTRPHAVSPHGHFMGYPQGSSRNEARQRLGLKADSTVFLQFGQVRAYKGLYTMLDAFGDLDLPGKHLLIAGRYAPSAEGPGLGERLRLQWLKRASRKVSMHLREIGNEEVQHYMAAADVLVLTHRAGLNSGVAVLGMSFGIRVVAPDLGCIPAVLGEGANFVYPAGNRAALVKAMKDAAQADAAQAMRSNRTAAASWRWEDTAQTVLSRLQAAT